MAEIDPDKRPLWSPWAYRLISTVPKCIVVGIDNYLFPSLLRLLYQTTIDYWRVPFIFMLEDNSTIDKSL